MSDLQSLSVVGSDDGDGGDGTDGETNNVSNISTTTSHPPVGSDKTISIATADSTNKPIQRKKNDSSANATAAAKARQTMVLKSGNIDEVSKKVGFIVDEFKCTHNNFSGILYCGPLGIVFLGRFLLFEWTVSVKWEDVVRVVQKQDSSKRGRPSQQMDIQIETRNNNNSLSSGGGSSRNLTSNSNEKSIKSSQVYLFEQFFDASKALNLLISLHNDSMLDVKSAPTPRMVTRTLRRNNSDPLRISNIFTFDDMPSTAMILEDDEEKVKILSDFVQNATPSGSMSSNPPHDDSTSSSSGGVAKGRMSDPISSLGSSAPSTRNVKTASAASTTTTPFKRSATYGGEDNRRTIRFDDGTKPSSFDDEDSSVVKVGTTSNPSVEESSKTDVTKTTSQKTDQAEWDGILTDVGKMKETLVKDFEILGVSLSSFVDEFIADDAPFSIAPQFMKENGEIDVTVSSWKENQPTQSDGSNDKLIVKSIIAADDPSYKTRTVEYVHPVNAPMAPPTAAARKEQKLKRVGDIGLIIETKTFVSDVPMTDCFYVCDVIQVQPIVTESDEGSKKGSDQTESSPVGSEPEGVIVNVKCDIRFVKSTMFQSLITKTTKNELSAFVESMTNFISRNAGSNDNMKGGDVTSVSSLEALERRRSSIHQIPPVQSSPTSSSLLVAIIGLLVFVILLQGWIIMTINQTNKDMYELKVIVDNMQTERHKQMTACPSATIDPNDPVGEL